jgi:hypothetical protein
VGRGLVWQEPASVAEPAVPAVPDGSVYTAGDGGTCAFAASTGRSRWCSGVPARHVTAYRGVVYAVGEGAVTAYDAGNGAVRWRRSFARPGFESTSYWTPVAGAGVLYAVVYHFAPGVHRHELLALAAADGRVLRRLDVAMPFEVGGEPLLLTRDRLYFATLAELQAYRLKRS